MEKRITETSLYFSVPLPVCPYLCTAMTQEQIKVMRDRIVVLRRFL